MKHLCKHKNLFAPLTVVVSASFLSTAAIAAGPTVNGNTISWTEDGWHQVQEQETGSSLCGGGRDCTVPNGVYKVINHGTGERFEFIFVTGDTTAGSGTAPAPVGATGQTESYEFGDDGDIQSGVVVAGVRFLDNDDGTFTDMLTGITWLGRRDCQVKRDWPGALDFANNLSAGGDLCPALDDGSEVGDWRLPTIKELYSLADLSTDNPAYSPTIPLSGPFWTENPWDLYWSSTSFAPSRGSHAWAFASDFAIPTINDKDSVEWVWVIRGGNQ